MPKTDLNAFPRPSLAVDVAVLTVTDGRLVVVLWRRTGRTETGRWALPGSFVKKKERLAEAVQRTLLTKCGIRGLAPTQLQVMDDPERDSRGWVVSVAHLDVVQATSLDDRGPDGEVALAPVRATTTGSEGLTGRDSRTGRRRRASILHLPDGQKRLPFDHEDIVDLAVEELRSAYRERPDPHGLLGSRFSILQLRRLHEAVAGAPIQKDNFRRAMVPHLQQLEEFDEGARGRPARLYRKL